jgi:hypothetical protein
MYFAALTDYPALQTLKRPVWRIGGKIAAFSM